MWWYFGGDLPPNHCEMCFLWKGWKYVIYDTLYSVLNISAGSKKLQNDTLHKHESLSCFHHECKQRHAIYKSPILSIKILKLDTPFDFQPSKCKWSFYVDKAYE